MPSHLKFAKHHFGNVSKQEEPQFIDISASRRASISVVKEN